MFVLRQWDQFRRLIELGVRHNFFYLRLMRLLFRPWNEIIMDQRISVRWSSNSKSRFQSINFICWNCDFLRLRDNYAMLWQSLSLSLSNDHNCFLINYFNFDYRFVLYCPLTAQHFFRLIFVVGLHFKWNILCQLEILRRSTTDFWLDSIEQLANIEITKLTQKCCVQIEQTLT